jgi:hypothetical protein
MTALSVITHSPIAALATQEIAMFSRVLSVPHYLTLAEAAVAACMPQRDLKALVANGTGPEVVRLTSRERMLFRDDLLGGWMARRTRGN